MAAWVEGRVIERIEWTPTLLSLRVEAELAPYKAGQFTKLALEQGERRVQRAYSFVNPPGTPYHEFYLVEIPGGELSPSLGSLQVGDGLLVQSQATGFLTLDEIPPGRDLWLLSTGTAIGPFLAMLAEGQVFDRFEHLVLVHGVRKGEELSYQPLIASFAEQHGERFRYVPFGPCSGWGLPRTCVAPPAISAWKTTGRGHDSRGHRPLNHVHGHAGQCFWWPLPPCLFLGLSWP